MKLLGYGWTFRESLRRIEQGANTGKILHLQGPVGHKERQPSTGQDDSGGELSELQTARTGRAPVLGTQCKKEFKV